MPAGTLLPAASDEAFERFVRLVRHQLSVPVALVSLVSAEEQVFPGAAGLPEPYQSDRRTPLSHSFCQHVVASAEPLVIEDARRHPLVRHNLAVPELQVIAYAGMPLTHADGRVIGSLCAIDSQPRRWTETDLAVLADLAGACSSELQLRVMTGRAAHAAEVAAREWRRTQRLLEERSSVAETLQRAMLPQLPSPRGLQLAGRYLPAHSNHRVGGDWFDGFCTADDVTVLAIGDTVGHDIAAAADMSQLRTLLRGYAVDRGEVPSDTMQRLDRAMLRLPVDAIASIVLARIEPASPSGSRRLRWTNAGPPPPLLLLPDGAVQVLRTPPDMLVGIDPTRPRRDHATDLPVGSTLVLYTDGLIERRSTGQDIDEGITALGRVLGGLQHLPADAILDRVLDPVRCDREDDIAALAIRVEG
ncbi:SpoIIE family protein phosphatase [Geodermatophilus obscurus]|uniref:SpoIIE family protein phosphatase n=1 Tax=Geodermatophilus obscurus TaxID=1861 RepID=UPI0009F9FBE2